MGHDASGAPCTAPGAGAVDAMTLAFSRPGRHDGGNGQIPDAPQPSTTETGSTAPGGTAGTARPKSSRSRAKAVKAPDREDQRPWVVDGKRRPRPAGRRRGRDGGSGQPPPRRLRRQPGRRGPAPGPTGVVDGAPCPLPGPLQPPRSSGTRSTGRWDPGGAGLFSHPEL